MKASDYLQIENHVAGKRVVLVNADGEDSGEWFHIVSHETRQASIALSKFQRKQYQTIAEEGDDDTKYELIYDLYTRYLAELVTDWSFDEECTQDHIYAILSDATKIRNQLDRKIHDSDFFTRDSED